jgi:hypothetical protein
VQALLEERRMRTLTENLQSLRPLLFEEPEDIARAGDRIGRSPAGLPEAPVVDRPGRPTGVTDS